MATKEEIISYVMKTPANTNEAVLRSMLDTLGGGGASKVTLLNLTWIDEDNASLGITWQELYDRFFNEIFVVVVENGNINSLELVTEVYQDDIFYAKTNYNDYFAATASDYLGISSSENPGNGDPEK